MARFYIPVEIERRVRKDAQNRCGYCLSPQRLVMASSKRLDKLKISMANLLKLIKNYAQWN